MTVLAVITGASRGIGAGIAPAPSSGAVMVAREMWVQTARELA